jgi:hypothetical protein
MNLMKTVTGKVVTRQILCTWSVPSPYECSLLYMVKFIEHANVKKKNIKDRKIEMSLIHGKDF